MSQSPEGSAPDFHLVVLHAVRGLAPLDVSQSPEGSAPDFHKAKPVT